jgi:hypothetical protein
MSAHIEVIDQYLEGLVDAAIKGRPDEAVELMLRIRGNYAAALNDVDTYHRYFTEVRDLLYAQGCTCGERGQCSYCGWFDKRKGQR